MNELEFVTLHRRHLHQYPELSLHEFETTSYITSFLEDLGVPYDRPLKTGVIAYLEGNSHHTIAFRADIDALPTVSYTHLTLPTMSLVCRSRWSPYH